MCSKSQFSEEFAADAQAGRPLWFIIQDIKHLTGTDRDYRPSDAWSRKPPAYGVYIYAIYMLGYLEQIVSAVFTWEKKDN